MAYDTEHNQLRVRSNELITSISKMTEQNDPAVVLRSYMPTHGAIRIVQASGDVKPTVQNILGMEKFTPKIEEDKRYSKDEFEGISVLVLNTPIIWTNGEVVTLQMIERLDDVEKNLTTLILILTVVTLLAMIPIAFSSIALGRIVTQPIEKLINAMDKSRNAGTYERIAVQTKGKDELAQMSRTFNEMMGQLEQNFKQQEIFVSNASHELKTPLTVIESYARLLTRHGFEDRAVAEEAIGAVLSESVRMKVMIEQLLQLANDNNMSFKFEELDIYTLVEQTLEPMSFAYARNFILEGASPLIATSDKEKLKQLLYILFDNARKYSEGDIKTVISRVEKGISISVIDNGDGISGEDIPHLFDRFYRVDEARNRKTGGTGLGLAIAKDLATGLDAELNVESTIGEGTTFQIILKSEKRL